MSRITNKHVPWGGAVRRRIARRASTFVADQEAAERAYSGSLDEVGASEYQRRFMDAFGPYGRHARHLRERRAARG